jgi:hypothetical protein
MARMKPPAIPQQPVPVPSTADVQTILKGASGNDFEDRRDTAIIRLFADPGIRLAELAGRPASSARSTTGSSIGPHLRCRPSLCQRQWSSMTILGNCRRRGPSATAMVTSQPSDSK